MFSPLPPSNVCRRLRAFTLIELLAVVAVLGILTALLVPMGGKMIERAEEAKCAANLRQIGSAVNSYAGENNGAFPRGGWGDSGALPLDPPGTDGVGWLTDIYPYVDERREVFICPSGEDTSPTGAGSWTRMPGKTWADPLYPMHYAYNAQLNTNRAAFRNNNPPLHVDRMAGVKMLSGLPVMVDVVFQSNFYGGVSALFSPNPPATTGSAFGARHRDRGNILWGDGRVTAMTREEWSALPDARVTSGGWVRYRFCNGDY